MVLGMIVQYRLKSKFAQYRPVPTSRWHGLAERSSGEDAPLTTVSMMFQITPADGFLSDHYNPLNKTVNLSP